MKVAPRRRQIDALKSGGTGVFSSLVGIRKPPAGLTVACKSRFHKENGNERLMGTPAMLSIELIIARVRALGWRKLRMASATEASLQSSSGCERLPLKAS